MPSPAPRPDRTVTAPTDQAAAAQALELARALGAAGDLLEAHLARRRRALTLLGDWTGRARDRFDAQGAGLSARLDPAGLTAAATRARAAAERLAAPASGGGDPAPR